MEKAAELGFEYVEPMVHWGRELLSAAGYFHSISMLDDPARVRRAAEDNGLKISALSAHAPLAKPDVSTDYLRQAVRFAKECGAPVVVTDDGPNPVWTTSQEDHTLIRYVLHEVTEAAESRGITLAIETHGEYSCTPAGLDQLLGLVKSPALGVNFDTGNSYLSGNDSEAWLESIIDRVVHIHAKDISAEDAAQYRGKVRGMLGCACGQGVLDWQRIIDTCEASGRDIVLSVECKSIDDAHGSLDFLSGLVKGPLPAKDDTATPTMS